MTALPRVVTSSKTTLVDLNREPFTNGFAAGA